VTTAEILPGYQFATFAHSFSIMHPKIIDDFGLLELGLDISPRDPLTMSIQPPSKTTKNSGTHQ